MREIVVGTDKVVPILDPHKVYAVEIIHPLDRIILFCNKIDGTWGFSKKNHIGIYLDFYIATSLEESTQQLYNAVISNHHDFKLFCLDSLEEFRKEF